MELKYESRNVDFYCRDSRLLPDSPLGVKPHLHYHIEMGCLIEGKTRMFVDSDEYHVDKGDFFILFPNQVHSMDTVEKEKYVLFIFNPDMIPEYSKVFVKNVPKEAVLKYALEDTEILSLMYKISDASMENSLYSQMMIRGYLLVLLSKLFSKIEFSEVSSSDTKLLGLILNYCVENYDQPLTLSVLEKELHISKFYISHTLSSKLHIGFNDYVNSLRVSSACRMLLDTDMSITEISDKVGFNTLRTFNRAFMKHMKLTPSEYRAQKTDFGITSMPV